MVSDTIRISARVLLASVFIVVGLQRLLSGLGALGGTAPPLATTMLVLSALEVVLGLLIVLAWRLKWFAALAALVLLADAYWSHPFWVVTGPAFAAQLLHFMKNISIVGGFLLLAATAAETPKPWFRR
jgi:putative oxidoreductase